MLQQFWSMIGPKGLTKQEMAHNLNVAIKNMQDNATFPLTVKLFQCMIQHMDRLLKVGVENHREFRVQEM
jgi:hypothetical protein